MNTTARLENRDRPADAAARWLPPVALALLVVALVVWVSSYALDFSRFATVDELWAVLGSRLLEQDFAAHIAGYHFNRGPERLASLLMLVPTVLLDGAPDQLRGGHVVLSTVYFLTAAPLYWLARGVGLTRWAAAAVGALGILGPWVLFGTTLLNTTTGLPFNMLFAYAAWRAATRPALLNDVLVLAAAALNGVARTGNLPLTAVMALAVAYAVWVRRPTGEPLRRYPVALVRTHPLLAAAVAAGLVVLVVVGPGRIVGPAYSNYGSDDFDFPLHAIWEHLIFWFAELGMATGFIPIVIGGAWALREVVRPRSVETGTLAVVALGCFAAFVYLTGSTFSTTEERYVATLAGLPAVLFGAAVFRREAWPLGTLVVGLLFARAVATWGVYQDNSAFAYFIAPARIFFTHVVLGRLRLAMPAGDEAALTVATLGIVAIAVVVAVACSPRGLARLRLRSWWPPAAVAGALVLFLGVTSVYTLRKFEPSMDTADRSPETMAWIDAETRERPTMWWNYGYNELFGGRDYISSLATHFNRAGCCAVYRSDIQPQVGARGELPYADPEFLVRFDGFHQVGFATKLVRAGPDPIPFQLRLERFVDPPGRAAFLIDGPRTDGRLAPGRTAYFRLLPAAMGAGRCLAFDLLAPKEQARGASWRIEAGDRVVRGTTRPGAPVRRVEVPTRGLDTVKLTTTAGDGRFVFVGESGIVNCGEAPPASRPLAG